MIKKLRAYWVARRDMRGIYYAPGSLGERRWARKMVEIRWLESLLNATAEVDSE